jgi:uncharacterized protein YcfJ
VPGSAEKEIDMTSHLQKVVAILLIACVLPAWAGHKHRDPAPRYGYAKVVDLQPVYESVLVPEDHRVCHDQVVQQRVAEYRSPAPAIFGAIVGGVIGNQLSRGHGDRRHHRHKHNRTAATFAGAVIGGAVASEIQYSKYPAKYYTENVQVCNTQTTWHNQEQVVAWDVSWKFRGRIYHSRMDEPPGDRIRVRVN